MKRVGKSLPELLGSAALRYVTRLANPRRLNPPRFGRGWWLGAPAEADTALGDGPTARTGRLARIEAILFLTREPLGTRKLAQLADLADGTEARTLIRKLNILYDQEECAFRAVEVAGGYQLVTRPQFAPYLRRLHGPAVEVRLSGPAMETLAVVAYRQPVLRADVESIRGVQCGELLRQLMERDLVRIAGRSEELGRPFLYGTTRRFLQVFGLRYIEELPPVEAALAFEHTPEATERERGIGEQEPVKPSVVSCLTEEESTVKTNFEVAEPPILFEDQVATLAPKSALNFGLEAESEFDDDYEDEDEEDEDDFEESDDEDEKEPDDEDEGFEESDWEEVGDDEEWDDDEEEEEEEWEDDDEEEDEDWDEDDEDEDWDEDEDEDEDEEDWE